MKINVSNNTIVTYLVVLIIIFGQVPWPIWNILWIRTFLNLLLLGTLTRSVLRYEQNKFIALVCILLLYSFFILKDLTNLGNISIIFLVISLYALNNHVVTRSFVVVKQIMLLFLIPSLLLWVLYLIGINLPYSELNATWKDPTAFTSQYHNFYFFIVKLLTPFRFCFVFDEPGTLGTFLAFILAVEKFRITKVNIIFFIAGFFTLSVAFAILGILGIILFNYKLTQKKIISGITIIITLIILLNSVPVLKNELLPRFKIENGTISANKRNTVEFSEYYKKFINSNKIIVGVQPDQYRKQTNDFNNPTYKMFIVNYGIIGVVFLIAVYLIILSRFFSYYSLCFFILFSLSFLQRPYALESWQITMFFIAIGYYKNENMPVKDYIES